MGEMADYAIEQGMEEEEYRYDHPEEFEDENNDVAPGSTFHYTEKVKYKVCRNCGKNDLHWQISKTSGGWRLFNPDNSIHNCNKKFTKKKFDNKRLIFKKEMDNNFDYTKDAEFWAKSNPQALYWYMVNNPEKAKNVSEKAGAILARNLR